ncbi:hypothetical protein [Microbispora sp. GKU 823]|uniref:hypothetical protein n=1 Tax=Microbispora sp. GKU 823 TaxID=1652100 RepID=UPI001C4E0AC5|nr:hypothetical protein [Microbispora sp. GKU 823]
MKKIPTILTRDWNGNPKHVTREPNPDCAWVFDGEGTPTVKWDGTCVMLDDHGAWWARREVKPGKTPPPSFQAISTDEETGKTIGWEPVEQSSFAKAFHEALANTPAHETGTYELLGPKVNGNPDGFDGHVLMRHGCAPLNLRREAPSHPATTTGSRPS